MIAAEPVMANKSLRIKITSQRIEVVSGTGQQVSLNNEWDQHTPMGKNSGSQMSKSQSFKEKAVVTRANKRGPSAVEDQQEKRQKMERNVTQQCTVLLKALMRHPAGWVFNQPVDPVKLNIPDYFSIVKNPMDLGTIKSKLDKNLYLCSEEFAADVRLTFSNATLYNPQENSVHQMAVELKEHFDIRWKSLEEKWSREGIKFGSGGFSCGQMKDLSVPRQNCPKTPPLHCAVLPKKSKSSEEKTIWHSSDAIREEVKLAKPVENCMQKPLKQYNQRGTDGSGRHTGASVITKPTFSPVPLKCGKCALGACQCSLYSDSISTHTSSDLSVEGSLRRDYHAFGSDASGLGCQPKSMPTSQMSKSDPDSDGENSFSFMVMSCHLVPVELSNRMLLKSM
uniref:Bromodomain-containing protein n=1 Tax=Rhizophora mucronata TaxID=61149 RepID=A0A2P2M805_RHIMU